MNQDHQLALVDYTVVYGHEHLSSFRRETVQIIDVDEESLTLTYKTQVGATKNLVIIWNEAKEDQDLKVADFRDIKAKLIAMAKYSASKQGYSYKRITAVEGPNNLISYSMYALAAFFFTLCMKKPLIGIFFGLLFSKKTIALAEKYVVPFTVAVYGIHAAEMFFVVYPMTVKYRMPFKTQLSWLAMNFFEGFLVPLRLKKLGE